MTRCGRCGSPDMVRVLIRSWKAICNDQLTTATDRERALCPWLRALQRVVVYEIFEELCKVSNLPFFMLALLP